MSDIEKENEKLRSELAQAQAWCDDSYRQVTQLLKECKETLELLREIEWKHESYFFGRYYHSCIFCFAEQGKEHNEDCKLAAQIKKLEDSI